MCIRVKCPGCSKFTWQGCGLHIASALKGVEESDRCNGWRIGAMCQEALTMSSSSTDEDSKSLGSQPSSTLSSSQQLNICIIGAGLAGTMAAALLAKLGNNVSVSIYEKREDPRCNQEEVISEAFGASTSSSKRSINLALSYRGKLALREVGLLDEVMKNAGKLLLIYM